MSGARVVLLVLDAMPHRHVGMEVTPNLWALAGHGSQLAPGGGVSVLCSSTYPNHATFVTGVGPEVHGLAGNHVAGPDRRIRRARDLGPGAPTLFDLPVTSAAVLGDQHLVGVMGARTADTHWPPDGRVPEGCTIDEHGYPVDAETIVPLAAALADPGIDLVVAQLNGPDTAAHVFGPDSDAARIRYSATDEALGQAVAASKDSGRWDETLWLVVSDHDQEEVDHRAEGVDLHGLAGRTGHDVTVVIEGGAVVVSGPGTEDPAWWAAVDALDGVGGRLALDGACGGQTVVWGEPGRWFGPPGLPVERGQHAGITTRTQVGAVGGGHPAAASIARRIADPGAPPPATLWAGIVRELLG